MGFSALHRGAWLSLAVVTLLSSCNHSAKPIPPRTDVDVRRPFIGIWKSIDYEGRTYYISLEKRGRAVSNWVEKEEHGVWQVVHGKAQVRWNNGWVNFVHNTGGKYERASYAPGIDWASNKPTYIAPASRVSRLSSSR